MRGPGCGFELRRPDSGAEAGVVGAKMEASLATGENRDGDSSSLRENPHLAGACCVVPNRRRITASPALRSVNRRDRGVGLFAPKPSGLISDWNASLWFPLATAGFVAENQPVEQSNFMIWPLQRLNALRRFLLNALWQSEARIRGVELGHDLVLNGRPCVGRFPGSRIVLGERVVL